MVVFEIIYIYIGKIAIFHYVSESFTRVSNSKLKASCAIIQFKFYKNKRRIRYSFIIYKFST